MFSTTWWTNLKWIMQGSHCAPWILSNGSCRANLVIIRNAKLYRSTLINCHSTLPLNSTKGLVIATLVISLTAWKRCVAMS